MKIDREDTPAPLERKPTLAEAAIKYQADRAQLLRGYEDRPLDATYRHQADILHRELSAEVERSMPFSSATEAAVALALARSLLMEFEGDELTGIHAARLGILEGVQAFLHRPPVD
jgi:hypothetical protein